MKSKRLIAILCALVGLAPASSEAQDLYQLYISGSSATTDATGRIVPTPFNNQSLLQDWAANHGVSDTSGLGLAYHIAGNELGDTIDVINRTSGATVYTLFGLYFGESFGRMSLLSASGRQMRRLEYIYTDQNAHSLGSALITDYFFLDSSGHTNRTTVFGQLQYIVLPNLTHTNAQICSGNFITSRPWTFAGTAQ